MRARNRAADVLPLRRAVILKLVATTEPGPYWLRRYARELGVSVEELRRMAAEAAPAGHTTKEN